MPFQRACQIDGMGYAFSVDEQSFEEAQRLCTRDFPVGGRLANNLNQNIYTNLFTCQSRKDQNYWIGLKYKDDFCPNSNRGFHWLQSGNCFNGEPLSIQVESNDGNCRAVTIEAAQMANNVLPKSRLENCNQQNRYICQYMPSRPQSTTRRTATQLTSALNNDGKNYRTTTKSTSKNVENLLSPKVLSELQPTTSEQPDTTEGALKMELVLGIVGGLVFALLVGLILACYLKRQRLREFFRHKTQVLKHRSEDPYEIPISMTSTNAANLNTQCSGSIFSPAAIVSNQMIASTSDYANMDLSGYKNLEVTYSNGGTRLINPYAMISVDEIQEREKNQIESAYMKPFN